MSILETSQTIFNLVISLVAIVVTILISVIAYDVIKFIKSIKKFTRAVNKESAEIYEKINKFLESILNLSFIYKRFFKKKNKINK
jgi:hypothetical protein